MSSQFVVSDTVIVRALNYAWREHLPTYLALRSLVEGFSDQQERTDWLSAWLSRMTSTGRDFGYHKFKTVKGYSKESGQVDYRDAVFPSPLGMVAEAWLLSHYSAAVGFGLNVYSYLWPRASSGHVYRNFMSGYRNRNKNITSELLESPEKVAVFLDVSSYYPSIDKERAERVMKFYNAYTFGETAARDLADFMIRNLLNSSESGNPVGPALSHFIGNAYLAEFDSEMVNRWGSGYFRYVDDLCFVLRESEVDPTISLVEDGLRRLGLSLNIKKTTIVNAQDWLSRNLDSSDRRSEGESFGEVINQLSKMYVDFPERYEDINKCISDMGIHLPIRRIQANASYSRFVAFLRSRFNFIRSHGFAIPITSLFSSERMVVLIFGEVREKIQTLQDDYISRLRMLAQQELPSGGMARRWLVQDFRFLLNRLIYLCSREQYWEIYELTPDIDELYPQRCVIDALITGNIEPSLLFPGTVVKTIAELSKSVQVDSLSVFNQDQEVDIPVCESLLVYHVFGSDIADKITKMNIPVAMSPIVNAICGVSESRSRRDMAYPDEVQSLLLGRLKRWMELAVSTRWSPEEDMKFVGIDLGAPYESGEV